MGKDIRSFFAPKSGSAPAVTPKVNKPPSSISAKGIQLNEKVKSTKTLRAKEKLTFLCSAWHQPPPKNSSQPSAGKGANLEDDQPSNPQVKGGALKRKQAVVISDDDDEEPPKRQHPAPGSPSSPLLLATGTRVRVQGLQSDKGKDLNGKAGTIVGASDGNPDRVNVEMEHDRSRHSLKGINLVAISPEAPAPASSKKREREREREEAPAPHPSHPPAAKAAKVPSVLSSQPIPVSSPPSAPGRSSAKDPPPSSAAKKPRKSNTKQEQEIDPTKEVRQL